MDINTIEDLKSVVLSNIDAAKGHAQEIGKQRKDAYDYYYQKPFGNEREGRSQHVSPDVMQAVDYIKYMIMDALTSNKDLVRFEPENENDIEAAEQATEYVNHVLMKQNNGYKVLYDVVHDGLLLKNGFIKRYWKQKSEFSKEVFEGLNEPQLNALLAQDGVELISEPVETMLKQPSIDPMTGVQLGIDVVTLYSGEIEIEKDASHICVEAVPPEEFLISPDATSLEDADFVAHYRAVSKAELLSMGYDAQKVESIGESRAVESGTEKDYRNSFDKTQAMGDLAVDANGSEQVMLHECYIKLDVTGTGRIEIYKIDIAGNEILDYEEVTEYPFEYWSSMPIPHKFFGLSIADVSMQSQFTNSQVKRALTDYTLLTANPRYKANVANINNVRDLVDNRIGATISVNDIHNSVGALETPALNPAIFSLIETIEQDKERVTGLSRMAQGVNPQAFSSNNHRDTIKDMTKAGNLKPSGIARTFTEMLLRPLMRAIYAIALENDKQGLMLRMGDQYIHANPSEWKPRKQLSVSVALTAEDGMKRAQVMLGIAGQMIADPKANQLVGLSQTYALYQDIMKESGIVSPFYMQNPDTPEFMQQMQAQMQEQAAAQQAQMQMSAQQLELANKQIELTAMNNQAKVELDKYKHDDKMNLEREKQDENELMNMHERKMDYGNAR